MTTRVLFSNFFGAAPQSVDVPPETTASWSDAPDSTARSSDDQVSAQPSNDWPPTASPSPPISPPVSTGGSGPNRWPPTANESQPARVGAIGIPDQLVSVTRQFGTNVDGYSIFLPRNYEATSTQYPVIVFLQGGGGVGGPVSQVNRGGIPFLLDSPNVVPADDPSLEPLLRDTFVVVSPHIRQGEYYDDAKGIEQLFLHVAKTYRIDPLRVYLTGLSRGGSGTWGLLDRFPSRFAAAAPLAGGLDGLRYPDTLTRMPLWVAHNRNDAAIPFAPCNELLDWIESQTNTRFLRKENAWELGDGDLTNSRIFTGNDSESHDAWSEVYTSAAFYRWLLTFGG